MKKRIILAFALLIHLVSWSQDKQYRVDFLLVDEFGNTKAKTFATEEGKSYPPGPTMHLFSALIALNEGVIQNQNSTLEYNCPHKVREKKVKCQCDLKNALLTDDIFYFFHLEEKIKKKVLKKYVQAEEYGNGELNTVWAELKTSGNAFLTSLVDQVDLIRTIEDPVYNSSFTTNTRNSIKKLLKRSDSLDYQLRYYDGGVGSLSDFHDWKIGYLTQNDTTYYFALHIQFSKLFNLSLLKLKDAILTNHLLENGLLYKVDLERLETERLAKQKARRDSVLAVRADTIYSLKSFYSDNPNLDSTVNAIVSRLNPSQKVGQLIMPAAGRWGNNYKNCEKAIKEGKVGGFIMLKGGYSEIKKLVVKYQQISKSNNQLPLIMSSDAEPSLINRKISGFPYVKPTNAITTKYSNIQAAKTINKGLNELGIHYNFAPDCDLGVNKAIIGNRSYGKDSKTIATRANEFIKYSENKGVITTAKHFPGHGLVKGDSHKNLVVIDGQLKELDTYKPLIDSGVLSIMIGHIAVKNNPKYDTKGQPSSISKTIVTDLLKKEMGFKGLVITDGMGMGGVSSIPNSISKAIEAGCDIVLMPRNILDAHKELMTKYKADKVFQKRVEDAVKKVVRMKVCLGIL